MNNLNIENIEKNLSNKWKKEYQHFLTEDNIRTLCKTIDNFNKTEKIFPLPLPHFKEEITEKELKKIQFKKVKLNEEELVKFIEKEPFKNLLVLIGQRLTSASVRNKEAIPPLTHTLIKSCFTNFNTQITFAVRAWEKHVGRTSNSIWGEIKGNPKEKEKQVKKVVLQCLENKTWWNVFYHYKHKLVYEIRISSGQGIRWSSDGKKLIGFLEPFL